MSEEIHEQISAFLDDELSAEESAFLVRRLETDARSRGQFIRYALIGSTLRGEVLSAGSSPLRRRIAATLNGNLSADAAVAATAEPTSGFAVPRSVTGFGVAALVAIVALFGLRALNQTDDTGAYAVAGAAAANSWSEPPSYVVPQEARDVRVVSPPIRLTNYLVQHGTYASKLSRTSISSNVVGVGIADIAADADFADGGVEP